MDWRPASLGATSRWCGRCGGRTKSSPTKATRRSVFRSAESCPRRRQIHTNGRSYDLRFWRRIFSATSSQVGSQTASISTDFSTCKFRRIGRLKGSYCGVSTNSLLRQKNSLQSQINFPAKDRPRCGRNGDNILILHVYMVKIGLLRRQIPLGRETQPVFL